MILNIFFTNIGSITFFSFSRVRVYYYYYCSNDFLCRSVEFFISISFVDFFFYGCIMTTGMRFIFFELGI